MGKVLLSSHFINCCLETFSASSPNAPSEGRPSGLAHAHLLVHEDVDDRVYDGAGLGQDGRDDAGLGRDQARRTEGGQQGHHAVRQPAQQVADDHDHDHEQHPLLALPAHRGVNAADLEPETGRGGLGFFLAPNRTFHTYGGSLASLGCLANRVL